MAGGVGRRLLAQTSQVGIDKEIVKSREGGGQRLLLGDPHPLSVCMENMKEEYRSDRFGFLSPVSVASGWMEIHFHKIHVKLAVFPWVPSPFKWLSE